MSRDLPTVNEVRNLIAFGQATFSSCRFTELARLGLVHLDAVNGLIISTKRAQRVVNSLPTDLEAVAAFFACLPEVRLAWLNVVSARLLAAGKRRDAESICQTISTLGDASKMARKLLSSTSLEPTVFGKLEVELFGEASHQPAVSPKLLRVLGATAWLIEGTGGLELKSNSIAKIEPLDPKVNWCGGRVIQLPQPLSQSSGQFNTDATHVLSGACSPLNANELETGDKSWRELMRWVLYRPWCMLLAQIVFTVEAWRAEQISGQMTLELAEDQISNPYEPKRVDVVVTTPDGSEILCGSLGQLVVRVLDRLQVTLLARDEEIERLDERLAGVIRLLLERKVWRFDPRGAGGSRPGYLIDDDFSTSCYRAFGSKYFYRAGSVLTAAIRSSAEQWASEKQAKSRELAGVER